MDEALNDALDRFQRAVEERDQTAASEVIAADFALVLVQPARAVMPRDRWLAVLPDYVVHEYKIEEIVVDIDDAIAVILHRDRMKATVLGEDRSGTFVITDVWRRTDDRWRLWRRHSTPLSAGVLPGTD